MNLLKKIPKYLFCEKPYITLVVTSKVKPYRFCCMVNNMSKKHMYYNNSYT